MPSAPEEAVDTTKLSSSHLAAYILGTITMVVIKNDERTGQFRDRSGNIKAYTKVNHIPRVSTFRNPVLVPQRTSSRLSSFGIQLFMLAF